MMEASANTKILLADDDAEDRLIIDDSFSEVEPGHSISYVEDGMAVLHFLQEITDEADFPDLIILDLNMPRLNGTETLRAIKKIEHYRGIPVVIFSTSVNEIEKQECLALGAVNYVTKPTSYLGSLEIARYFFDLAMR